MRLSSHWGHASCDARDVEVNAQRFGSRVEAAGRCYSIAFLPESTLFGSFTELFCGGWMALWCFSFVSVALQEAPDLSVLHGAIESTASG